MSGMTSEMPALLWTASIGPEFGFHAFERGADGSRVRDVRADGDDPAAVGADAIVAAASRSSRGSESRATSAP